MSEHASPVSEKYYLGCPVWSSAAWKGKVFPGSAPQKSWLKHYSQTFGTVEGNSTFYAIPSPETFERWASEVATGFRFALKFPRVITHEKALLNARVETELFLQGLATMQKHGCLGPTFLQFSDRFTPSRFDDLAGFLRDLPRGISIAIEVRNRDFFDAAWEERLNELVVDLGMDRIMFDSRPLYSAPPQDEYEARSQTRKPRLPHRVFATGQHPFLRFVGPNNVEAALPWNEEWAPVVADWIRQGKTPFVFAHTPNDRYCPDLACLFHREIARRCPELPAELVFPNQGPRQLGLF